MAVLAWSLAIASLSSLAAAVVNPVTYDLCVTELSPTSVKGPIPTTTYFRTIRIPHDVYVSTTPGLTITPSVVTTVSTITATATTESDVPQVTDTYTNTITMSITNTETAPTTTFTATATATTITTTTMVGTTTIPTPAGFSPVLDTLPGSSAKKHKRFLQGGSAAVQAKNALQLGNLPPWGRAGKGEAPPHFYPARVVCAGVVETYAETTITKTARTTTTVTASTPSTTVFTTVSTTITNVVTTPDAQTTVSTTVTDSFSATVTPSATTTLTSTSTIVIPTYTATAYAMCQGGSNFAGAVDGYGIPESGVANAALSSTSDTTAQACCNACAANPLCAATAMSQTCYLFIDYVTDACPIGGLSGTAWYSPGWLADSVYTISNGNCGQYNQVALFGN